MIFRRLFLCAALLIACLSGAGAALARDAAFIEPGAGGLSAAEEAIRVDPKPETDVGETALGVAKHVSVFFVNQTANAVKIDNVVINSDSNVNAEATANDCTKQGIIDAGSRCSVEVSVTATSPGPWNVDVLMTHNGAGRITRARLTGKTSGSATGDKQGSGLAVSAKDAKPVDFGEVTVGDGKTVRSTLMVNDSAEPITLYSIDVIEADNGLQRLDQGCAVDMELAPGASCPVTLLWVPKSGGQVSTDLIIRHSGRLGFAVIPIRGIAKGSKSGGDDTHSASLPDTKKDMVPLPPTALQLEKEMAGRVAPVSIAALGDTSGTSNKVDGDGHVHLIGTVGERALFLMGDGDTQIVPMGGDFNFGGKPAKLVDVKSHEVSISVGKERKKLMLEAASALVSRAAAQSADDAQAGSKSSSSNSPQSVALVPGSIKK